MTPLPDKLRRYLEKRGIRGPWVLEGAGGDFAGAVVIPALAEERSLGATLASLAENRPEARARFLAIVVINHRADAPQREKEENLLTLRRLRTADLSFPGLPLAWVDAASPGREIPPGEGVGLARKIGFDLALARLDCRGPSPLLASLDADTLVDTSYFSALQSHFHGASAGAAVLPFCHQPGDSPAEEAAIVRYELFLRGYVLGLALAGSPYAFHTVGSAMACRAEVYVRAGGMNRRLAAEDFYFLQQLAKISGVVPLSGTVVRPSARPSTRVPFGTGQAVARLLAGEDAVPCFPAAAFRLLGGLLTLVAAHQDAPAETIGEKLETFSPAITDFLRQAQFPATWARLQRNHRRSGKMLPAFHVWFDGLRTLRLLRCLAAGPCPRRPAEEAIPPLLAWAGSADPGEIFRQLALLRRLQNGHAD